MLGEAPSLAGYEDEGGVSVVLTALYCGEPEVAELLAEAKGALDIFEAAALGDLRQVRARLAEDESRIGEFCVDGMNALGLAALFGNESVVKCLLDEGASPNVETRNALHAAPLHAALSKGHKEVAAILVHEGADVNARASGGWTPLHFAAQLGDTETARLLLSEGADPSAMRDDGRTPAQIAEGQGFLELSRILGGT